MPDPKYRKKTSALKRGRMAEALSVFSLRCRGYRILARGFRAPVGEIDIIAQKAGVLVFIEVKARRDLATAADAITNKQRRRIVRAAMAFVQARAELASLDQRFDAMLVMPWALPVHLVDAWRPEH